MKAPLRKPLRSASSLHATRLRHPYGPCPALLLAALLLPGGLAAHGQIQWQKVNAPAIDSVSRSVLTAAWGDYDGDGRPDLYMAAVDVGSGILIRNRSEGFQRETTGPVATDIASRSGVAWGDWDNDGRLDLFVAAAGATPDRYYRNLGSGTFEVVSGATEQAGQVGMSAIAFDYDRDGWLDLFVVNGGGAAPQGDYLYRNSGNGTLVWVDDVPVVTEAMYSHGAAIGDYDGDGNPDIYVGHAWTQVSSLFRNLGSGRFDRVLVPPIAGPDSPAGVATVAWGDYDNDGDLDLYIVGTENLLFRNDGPAGFTLISNQPVTGAGADSAGAVWADFDNDGWLDLLVSRRSGGQRLYRSLGNGQFSPLPAAVSALLPNRANGVAIGDYDGDGLLDVLFSNWEASDGAPSLYRNTSSPTNGWLRVQLRGVESNRLGIGAVVRVEATIGGRTLRQMRQVGGFDSVGTHELAAHFGMGDAAIADTVRIEWPSGIVQELHQVALNRVLEVAEGPLAPIGFTPAGGSFTNSVRVTLTAGVPGAEIRYSIDGSEPVLDSNLYAAPFTLHATTTVRARLFLNGFPASDIVSAVYTADPGLRFVPNGGLFTNRLEVSVVTRLAGVSLRYTTNGTEPTLQSAEYGAPVSITAATTFRARAFLQSFPVSEVITAVFERVYAFDNDGIPADWRIRYFGEGYRTDPRAAVDADPDGDGSTNLQEFVADTDPLDPLSGFAVGIRAVPEIRFASVPSRTYRILRRTSVTSPESTVVATVVATGDAVVHVDLEAGLAVNPSLYVVELVE
ncbi:MAG: VCBS repeat-containing protein [Verrucomicrobiae bacterium]|nr:VCBS repeat-containing protein [Verrucomicrobiae bacterium]